MIARGAIHNPDIFNEYKEYIKNPQNFKLYENVEIDNDNEIVEEITCEKEKSLKQSTNKNKKDNDNDIQMSNKLCKILEKKYCEFSIDIKRVIQEYLELVGSF